MARTARARDRAGTEEGSVAKASEIVGERGEGMRADLFLSDVLGLLSRSQVRSRGAAFRVNGKAAKASRRLKSGDEFEAEWPDEKKLELAAEDIPLTVLYEDDDVIAIDKAQGMVVHPGNGHSSGTLVNALLGRLVAADFPDPARAGIVHRLDKDTSGVIIAAKHPTALEKAQAEFRARRTEKRYLAIVRGGPREGSGRIVNLLARHPVDRKRFAVVPASEVDDPRDLAESAHRGKIAISEWKVLARWKAYSLVVVSIKTGRTHQIRVHLSHLGCPILGDAVYGVKDARFPKATLMLHAWRLALTLPSGARREFRAPMPSRFKGVIRALGVPESVYRAGGK
jgi:23S rRNA pseudouridine1911/1915/1917 synthase